MIKVTYEGFAEMGRYMTSRKFALALGRGLAKAWALVYRGVSVETPVRTGTLQRGWKMVTGTMQVRVENNVKYWPFVNDGTRFISAQQFMEKWFNKVAPMIHGIIAYEVKKAL